jgi:Tfp pilus assembly protein PilO
MLESRRIKNLDRVCLALLVAAALAGAAWNTGVFVRQERRLQQDKERSSQEIRNLEQANRNRKAIQSALSQLQPELADMNKRVPQKTDMGALLKQMNLRMKERRIAMAAIQPQTAVPEGLYTKIPIRLVFQGTFMQIYLFLYDLERMDRLLVTEKVTISASEPHRMRQVDLTVFVFERKPTGKSTGAGG